MTFSLKAIIRAFVAPSHRLRCSPRLWRNIVAELERRGENRHEAGAFLLGTDDGVQKEVREAVYYDELDPDAYESGVCILHGESFSRLWSICREKSLTVVGDAHTHPGVALQSDSDRTNPMVARERHIAIIVPDFARWPVVRGALGIYEYVGDHAWYNRGGRGAKYFMDSGRAATHEEAMQFLKSFGLTVFVGPSIAASRDEQVALLTLVNTARRSFLAGVVVVGLPEAKPLTRLTQASTLAQAVKQLGGRIARRGNAGWPAAVIGDIPTPISKYAVWRLAWSGWRAGVVIARAGDGSLARPAMPLAPVLAAACCAAEAFAYHAKDHVMAGHRSHGMSLWDPGANWLVDDMTEPELSWLPSQLWLIGLGNLGQAFAWSLVTLPYANPAEVKLVLQDDDRIAVSNDSTSILSFTKDVGQRKARCVGAWLDGRGFDTCIVENRFGTWTTRAPEDPAVALCGVDNATARAALDCPNFGLVLEAGLGAGPEGFRSFLLHSFPGTQCAVDIWGGVSGPAAAHVEHLPAYESMRRAGAEACGLTQLASRTVGVPFVGLTAGVLVIAELLRRLHGGEAFEFLAGSALALDAFEAAPMSKSPYAFGHVQSET